MPRPFVFRLQPVLDQRERIEREHQLRVAELERDRLAIETRIRSCQEQIIAAKHELREHMGATGGRVIIDAVRLQSNASLHLVALARQAVLELAGVHRRLDLARAELAKAAASRKAVSLLKDRQREQWRHGIAKREAAELDELIVMNHARTGASL